MNNFQQGRVFVTGSSKDRLILFSAMTPNPVSTTSHPVAFISIMIRESFECIEYITHCQQATISDEPLGAHH